MSSNWLPMNANFQSDDPKVNPNNGELLRRYVIVDVETSIIKENAASIQFKPSIKRDTMNAPCSGG